jgi:fermentation-respiration switch protein FrsA (DUF1100 family)
MRHEGVSAPDGERGGMPRLLAVVLVAAALVAPRASAHAEHASWSGRYSVVSDGQVAEGWLAYPTDIQPDTLLVFGHGCCGPLPRNWADMLALHHARHNGMVVVAMDYRGPANGWNVGSGHADLVAAAVDLSQRFHITRVIAWGVSMGGEVTGMAVAERPDVFDYWISSAGTLDLPTQWGQQTFRAQIEKETHGTPVSNRSAYNRRSPTELAPKMRGLEHAYLLHGLGDGAVPASQSQQMYDRLRRAGVDVSAYTIATGEGDPTVWWPLFATEPTPIGVAGHDWSTIALAQRILLRIVAGHAPDAGAAATQHFWDSTTDAML